MTTIGTVLALRCWKCNDLLLEVEVIDPEAPLCQLLMVSGYAEELGARIKRKCRSCHEMNVWPRPARNG